jgi:hypothetical protein
VVTEARLERLASGLAAVTPGWFIVTPLTPAGSKNEWYGGVCIFESDDVVLRGRPDLTEYVKPHAGFTIRVVPPGQTAALYHAESVQEDFLILMGECTLIIEDQERHLRAWDFGHCPPMTRTHSSRRKQGHASSSPRETAATISNGCAADPRPGSATTPDLMSIRLILSAEADGGFSVQNTGTNSRGLNGRSSRGGAAAFRRSAAAHRMKTGALVS